MQELKKKKKTKNKKPITKLFEWWFNFYNNTSHNFFLLQSQIQKRNDEKLEA